MEEGDIVVLFLVQDLGAFYGQFPGAGEVVGQLGGVGFVDAERRGIVLKPEEKNIDSNISMPIKAGMER